MAIAKMSDAQRRRIFALAKEKGLEKEVLSEFVQHLTGKASMKNLNIREAITVIDGLAGNTRPQGMITGRQKSYIEGLAREIGWTDETGKLDMKALSTWINNKYGVGAITWLTTKKASDAIEGLKAIKGRMAQAEAI